tara:strand:- start:46 stop:1443 length:1398 start_codon:yes stop_codon:yes gene_type:complete
MENNVIKDLIKKEFNKIKHKLEDLFITQWNDPELPGMEKNSSRRLAEWLDESGFDILKSPFGIPTAFLANSCCGKESINIGILAEYDALPGLDNEADYKRKPTGKIAGHGCGHNHIGPVNVGAAIVASNVCKAINIPSKITLIGCPAEEILWGKIALFNKGAFSGLDCILTSHGDYQNGSICRPCQSVVAGEIIFEGETGHGGQIYQKNALNAVEKTINFVEENLTKKFPEILFRHVIRNSGDIPNVTPLESRVWYAARGFDFLETRSAYNEILKEAKKISTEMGINYHHQFISETRGYLPNNEIGKSLYEALKIVGPPKWSSEDIVFMEKLVAEVKPGAQMNLHKEIAYFNKGVDSFGQDDGELSWRIPLGRLNWAYPEEIPIHHWAWTALSGNKASNPGPIMVCEALALATVNLLKNPIIIEKAKKELTKKTQEIKLENPRLGAFETITKNPEAFWNGTWREP